MFPCNTIKVCITRANLAALKKVRQKKRDRPPSLLLFANEIPSFGEFVTQVKYMLLLHIDVFYYLLTQYTAA